MRIDKKKAADILTQSLDFAINNKSILEFFLVKEKDVLSIIDQVCKDSEEYNLLTHISFLGTMILAKATNTSADSFSLKSSAGTPGSYSARSLCKDVLAKLAIEHHLDIGVKGREPLNNQPYFSKSKINDIDNIAIGHSSIIIKNIIKIASIFESKEKNYSENDFICFLNYYCLKRLRKNKIELKLHAFEDDFFLLRTWINHFEADEKSMFEKAKIVQSLVTSIISAIYHDEYELETYLINDPDVTKPGDVCLKKDGKRFRVFEVRAKIVDESDISHIVSKSLEQNVHRITILALHERQPEISSKFIYDKSKEHNVLINVYLSIFEMFISELICTHKSIGEINSQLAIKIIQYFDFHRINQNAIKNWNEIFDKTNIKLP